MASFSEYKGGWRAQVYKDGKRKSKVLPTRERAEKWAASMESKLQELADRIDGIKASRGIPLSAPTAVLDAMSRLPHTREEIMMASIPHHETSGVYFLMRGPDIIYVGQSLDVLQRISRHRREGRSFDAFSYIICPVDGLDELEADYIRALVPEENWSFGNRYRGSTCHTVARA